MIAILVAIQRKKSLRTVSITNYGQGSKRENKSRVNNQRLNMIDDNENNCEKK